MVNQFHTEAMRQAQAYGIDPALFEALVTQESGWNPNAVSHAGAQGLTQIMPATGKDPGFGVSPVNIGDTTDQLRFGAEYLKAMLDRYGGDERRALAAYNAGFGRGDSWDGGDLSSLPDETQGYVSNIMNMYQGGNGGTVTSTKGSRSVDDHINGFDKSIEEGGMEQPSNFLQKLFGGGVDPDNPYGSTELSGRQRVGGALSNIGDRLTAYGQGRAISGPLSGDRRLASLREQQGANKTAQVLASQGHTELAQMVASGQMSGAQAMNQIRGNQTSQEKWSMVPQDGIDADGNPIQYVTSNMGNTKILDTEGVTPTTSGWVETKGETGSSFYNPRTQETRFVPNDKEAGVMQASEIAYAPLVESYNTTRPMIVAAYSHPGLDEAVGAFQGGIDVNGAGAMGLSDEARAFVTMHDQLVGTVFLEAYNQLKGGGQITEIEAQKAEAAKARLNRKLSPAEYRKALQDYESALREGLAKLDRARRGEMPVMDDTPAPWDSIQETTLPPETENPADIASDAVKAILSDQELLEKYGG